MSKSPMISCRICGKKHSGVCPDLYAEVAEKALTTDCAGITEASVEPAFDPLKRVQIDTRPKVSPKPGTGVLLTAEDVKRMKSPRKKIPLRELSPTAVVGMSLIAELEDRLKALEFRVRGLERPKRYRYDSDGKNVT